MYLSEDNSQSTTIEVPDIIKKYVTQWGKDPIWASDPLPIPTAPLPEYFHKAVVTGTRISLAEQPDSSVVVVGHEVGYNATRQLWYCDIELDPGLSYFPFIRLLLVRYQPKSVPDAHISPVILADFAQLMPNRSASIVFDPSDPRSFEVAITGRTYDQPTSSPTPPPPQMQYPVSMQVTVETQPKGDFKGEMAWIPLFTVPLTGAHPPPPWCADGSIPNANGICENGNPAETDKITLWIASVTLPSTRDSRCYRLRLEEFENHSTGPPPPGPPAPDNQSQKRLIYAAVLPI